MSDVFSSNGDPAGAYTTSRGIKIKFLGIATLIEALRASLEAKKPTPPTYEVTTLGGAVERHVHDATTLETEADQAAYAEYEKNLTAWDAESQRALMRLMLLRGVSVEMPNDTQWETLQRAVGIDVPSDEIEKRLPYLQTEVLGGVKDYEALVVGVMKVSGVPEEVLAQVEESFRGVLGRNQIARPADPRGVVAGERAVRAGSDGVRAGVAAK